MGGKSSQSTQQIQIPPEVLARYNAVNARAETTANRPFQQYSTDPSAFVAPLTETQQAGIANTNYYSGTAQPYYQAATQQLGAAQQTALPFYNQAAQQVGQAQNVGNQLAGMSMQTLGGAQNVGQQLAGLSMQSLYGGQQAAQTPQRQAYSAYNQAYSGAQPFQGAATNFALAGAQAVNPNELGAQQINQYMSPYLANVLQGTAALQNQMNQQAMSGQTGNAIRQGAFGGDRAGIAAANLAQQQQLANAKTFSDILNQGYGQGLATAQQQQQLGLGAAQANRAALQQAGQQLLGIGQQGYTQGMGYGQAQQGLGQQLFGQGATSSQQLSNLGQQQFGQGLSSAQQQAALGQQQFGQGMTAAQQNAALGAGLYGMGSQTAQGLANLGTGAQAAGLQGAQAQLAAGQAQQQTEQAGLQALYNQFLQQQSYPFQVAQFLANIAMGTGALSGSTTQTNQMLSDKRLKENIKPVGKTFDGQTIYSYNFKGEPQTEIGLIAQEVQKHHPEAVGLAGGYRTVNYDKATEDAADRGHFAAGGAAMGGGVMPYHAGEGFFDGGSVGYDPSVMQQVLAAYERMYAPLQGMKGGLGAASFVPESNLPVGQLMTAGDLPDAPPGLMDSAKGMVTLGTGLGELGGNLGAWDYTDAQRAATERKKKAKEAEGHAYGGLAGGRHGYEDGGITVVGRKEEPEEPEKIKVPSATPAPAPLAPVAKVDTAKTVEKPAFQKVGLDIPQIANTVGLTPAAALTPLEDKTGETLSGIGKVASALPALFAMSDRRLKENIKPVGKTFDGQTVYSYNYKGEHQTRMGLIAQEVEKHQPHAVGHAGGYKTVDYKKATSGAAHRGHFAFGGETDDNTMGAPGLNIPTEGNKVGLAAAPGLSPLQDKTGDILNGVGSVAKAIPGLKGMLTKKAEGGFLEGEDNPIRKYLRGKMNPLSMGDEGRSLDSGEFWGLGSKPEEEMMPEQAMPAGLAAAEPKIGAAPVMKPTASVDKPAGLAPPTPKRSGAPLPTGIKEIAKLIFAGEGTGKNPDSSAYGPYQFIDSTFVGQFRKHYPEQARGMSDRDIVRLKNSPEGREISADLGPKFIAENAKVVENAGFEPNAGNVYLAHFLGPRDALRVLRANPEDSVAKIVDPDSIRANKVLQGGQTAGGIVNWAHNYMAKQARHAEGFADGGTPKGLAAASLPENDPEAPASFEKQFDEAFAPSGGLAPTEAARNQVGYAERLAGKAQEAATADKGLAAALAQAPKKPGILQKIAQGDFISGLGEGKATSWIPLVTGIGEALSGPYKPLVGLGRGISAGAQARQAQYEFGRQLRETGALEKTAASQEFQSRTQRIEELRNQLQQALDYKYTNPTWANPRIAALQQELAKLGVGDTSSIMPSSATPPATPAVDVASGQSAAPAVAGQAGAPTPSAPVAVDEGLINRVITNPTKATPGEIQQVIPVLASSPRTAATAQYLQQILQTMVEKNYRITDKGIEYIGGPTTTKALSEGSVEDFINTQNNLNATFAATVNALPTLEALENSARAQEQTNWQTSPITQRLAPAAATINALSNFFLGKPIVNPEAVSNIEEMNKASSTLAVALADRFRGTAGAEVLSQLGTTVPTSDLSPQGVRKLISVVRQAMLANRDQKTFVDEFGAKNANNPMALRNVFTEYNKVRPTGYWSKRARFDYELSDPKKPLLSAQQVAAIKAQGGDLNARINSKQTLRQWLDASFGSGSAQPIVDVLKDNGAL